MIQESSKKGLLGSELLGDVVQVCLVTRELKRTMDHFLALGIGPWRLQTLDPTTLFDARLRGEPQTSVVRTATTRAANMMWEIVEPQSGVSIFHEFLEAHGEGVHHLGFLCPGRTFAEAVEEFKQRGYSVIQSGRWMGQAGNAFLGTGDALGMFLEIWDRPPGFVPPEPEEWYPPNADMNKDDPQ